MLKRYYTILFFLLFLLAFPTAVYAADAPELKELEPVVKNATYAGWSLTGLYTLFNLVKLGWIWMFSGTNPEKMAQLKQQALLLVVSLVVVFGGWIGVRTLFTVLNVSPDCVGGASWDRNVVFQFFFKNPC